MKKLLMGLKSGVLILILFISSTQFSFGQYSTTVNATDGSYSVTVDISIDSVIISSTSCPWGYNYSLHINYRITFTGTNIPANLWTLQLKSVYDNKGNLHTAQFGTKQGEYSAESSQVSTTDTDCGSISVPGLDLGNLELYIQGPSLDETVTIIPGSGTYPIELIHFSAKAHNNAVEINWATATEENNDFFTIERSQDGHFWEAISLIPGAGNSNEIRSYETHDVNPLPGVSYYRLKQTDYNGQFTYSKVVSINNEMAHFTDINIYPNPSTGRIFVEAGNVQLNEIEIYNSMGQNVSSQVQIARIGDAEFSIDLSALPAGYYIVSTPYTSEKNSKEIGNKRAS